jgi:hypothetical protein
MPGKLSDSKQRVSMAEEISVVEQLKAIALREGKTLTDVYSEAARLLIDRKTKSLKRK